MTWKKRPANPNAGLFGVIEQAQQSLFTIHFDCDKISWMELVEMSLVRWKKVISKYFEFLLTKVKILYEQKKYEHNGVTVKYLLKEEKGIDTLVIVFSSCTRKGLKARYNYVRTLEGLKCNRLHILDDYAEDGRGSYYLGRNFTFNEEKATDALIEMIVNKLRPRKVVFCGSSKGGYAALNFGLKRECTHIIAGGPQYFLASYLKGAENSCTYRYIVGENSEEKERLVEYYLQEKIRNNPHIDTQKIYLHYSTEEHTYKEHICFLLRELRARGYSVLEDVESYANHSEISYYFPDFLKKTIKGIIDMN